MPIEVKIPSNNLNYKQLRNVHKGLPPNYKEKIVTYDEVVNMNVNELSDNDDIKHLIIDEEEEDEDDEILIRFK